MSNLPHPAPDTVVLLLSIEDATRLRDRFSATRYAPGGKPHDEVVAAYMTVAIEQAIRRSDAARTADRFRSSTDGHALADILPLVRQFDPTDQDPT